LDYTLKLNNMLKVLGTIMFNPHPFADEIKRHPEVETPLVTRDNRTEVMRKVLNWLTEE
jgi:nucleoside-triphosphatase THEP1